MDLLPDPRAKQIALRAGRIPPDPVSLLHHPD
jgi:hypothetical protein